MRRSAFLPLSSRLAPAAILLACTLLPGCGKGHKASNDSAPAATLSSDASAVDLYNAKRYAEAKAKAEADIPRTKGREKEVNQLTAGLAACALKQSGLAEHYLQPLVHSGDPAIAGRAQAGLAQVVDRKGNHGYAADLFKRASGNLDGADAQKAAVRAGVSQSEASRPSKAAAVPAKPGQGSYTIQLGAFSTKAAADKRAKEVAPAAAKAGLASPRVVPEPGQKAGYSVQVGAFAVKQAAIAAMARMGSRPAIVVAME